MKKEYVVTFFTIDGYQGAMSVFAENEKLAYEKAYEIAELNGMDMEVNEMICIDKEGFPWQHKLRCLQMKGITLG